MTSVHPATQAFNDATLKFKNAADMLNVPQRIRYPYADTATMAKARIEASNAVQMLTPFKDDPGQFVGRIATAAIAQGETGVATLSKVLDVKFQGREIAFDPQYLTDVTRSARESFSQAYTKMIEESA